MSWKDYFYFTKTERNGITVMIILIICILFAPLIYEKVKPLKVYDYSEALQMAEQHQKLLVEYADARKHFENERIRSRASTHNEIFHLTPELFDPNVFSREEFMEMGLPERIANNIVNYRNAGGLFRNKEDLQRIYSISDDLYVQLEDYIDLPSRKSREFDTATNQRRAEPESPSETHQTSQRWADLVIDINRADTIQWQQIRGIGPVFSRRITSYRDLLGGFYSIEQLREVFGMDSTRFEQIADQLTLDSFPLKTININTAEFASLIRHPYLNRNQVNSIIQMRQRHGLFNSVDDIKKSELISEDDFLKLLPYLSITD